MIRKFVKVLLLSLMAAGCFILPAEALEARTEGKGTITKDEIKYRIQYIRDSVFERDGLSGIADQNGNILLEPKYTDIDNALVDQRIYVAIEDKYGYLDENYRTVIEPQYDRAYRFSGGLAQVEVDKERFYIDVLGNVASAKGITIEDRIWDDKSFFSDFSDGSFIGKRGVLNRKTDEIVIPAHYEELYLFPERNKYLAGIADITEDGVVTRVRYYEIDEDGKSKQVPINDQVMWVDDQGYITIYREFIVDYTPTEYDTGKDGTVFKMGLLDRDYHVILEPIHEAIWPEAIRFYDDRAIIKVGSKNWTGSFRGIWGDGKYGMIDRSGQYMMEPVYDQLLNLKYGKYLVEQNGITNVIDSQGKKLNYIYNQTEVASEWAKAELEEARYLGLSYNIFAYNSPYQFTWNITRQEFCEFVINLYGRVKGSEELPSLKNKQIFQDTSSESVLMAYELGIVKGVGEGRFSPYTEITRQEAATMLARLATQLGLDDKYDSAASASFQDDALIAAWAKDSVYTMNGIKEERTGTSIMGGTGNNRFSPLTPFTKEQTILTMLRLYNVAVPDRI